MPVVHAEALRLQTRRGTVFDDVTLSVDAGDLLAITGPAGSGRTSLLLALAGHFRTSGGRLTRDGRAALGLIPGAHEPEPGLTVAEHVRERLLLLGHRAGRGADPVTDALAGFPGDPGTLGRDLNPYQRHHLMLRLALLSRPALIAVDDVDVALSAGERADLWRSLREITGSGIAVIVTCRDLPDGETVRVHDLSARVPVPRAAEAEQLEDQDQEEVPA